MRIRLTDRFVKSATPSGRKSPIFMDDAVIGFGVQVRETELRQYVTERLEQVRKSKPRPTKRESRT